MCHIIKVISAQVKGQVQLSRRWMIESRGQKDAFDAVAVPNGRAGSSAITPTGPASGNLDETERQGKFPYFSLTKTLDPTEV